jgi:folate-binding protein YgfZ
VLIDCEASGRRIDPPPEALSPAPPDRDRDRTRSRSIGRSSGLGACPIRVWALGHRWIAPPDEPADGLARAPAVARRCPRASRNWGRTTLWLECNAAELNGVSFTKGCYVGQENTARMNWRQKVNRRLAVVRVEADPGETAMAWYPDLGLAVIRLRVEALAATPGAILPGWLADAIA